MASIHAQTNKGGRTWRVKWRYLDEQSGQWVQTSKAFKRKSDAELHRARVEIGETAAARVVTPTLRAVFDQWQATRRVSRARLVNDKMLSAHFGELDSMAVDKIRASTVRAWMAGLVDAGLSAETVSAILRILRSTLNAAMDDDLIAVNPAARVRAPKITRPPLDAGDVLTGTELTALLTFVPERWRALVALLAFVGPRWSEALAVRVSDLDMLRRRVHVGHRVAEEVQSKITIRGSGKTRGSDRWVPLPATVVDHLAEHLARHPAGRDQLVFRNTAGNPPLRGNFRQRVWRPAMSKLAAKIIDDAKDLDEKHRNAAEARAEQLLKIPTRNLRHTAASLMLESLPVLEVARRLGHSRPSITLDTYSRVMPNQDHEAAIDPYDAALRRNIDGTSAATNGSVTVRSAPSRSHAD